MKKVGIVGCGFVGNAVLKALRGVLEISIVDPQKYPGVTVENSLSDADIIFVGVPTPMADDRSIDSTIIESVFAEIVAHCPTALIVVKSTITPDVVIRLDNITTDWVYAPEFLTERNADQDFANAEFHIFGGNSDDCLLVSEFYSEHIAQIDSCEHLQCSKIEASLTKYAINSFLATKVMWFNQYKKVAEAYGVDYNMISALVALDHRIGSSHLNVPGPDGRHGFGGACFPKDTAALHALAPNHLTILGEVIARNNEVRSKYDLDAREQEQHVSFKD